MRGRGTGRWLIVLPFGDDFKGKPAESGEAEGPEKHDRHHYLPFTNKLLRQIILRDYEDAQENAVTSTTVRQTKKAARKGGLSPALEAYTAPS